MGYKDDLNQQYEEGDISVKERPRKNKRTYYKNGDPVLDTNLDFDVEQKGN